MSDTAAPEPLVSVIIPVYNAAKYLRETLDCVCNQTLREIEIICVDDGSTDDSPAILQEYAAKDGRFRILRQKNRYAGVARNNGMAVAGGTYMAFWDSDDIFFPEMLEKLYRRAQETNADLVCCNGMEYDEGTKKLTKAPWILPGIREPQIDSRLFNPMADAPEEVFSYSGSAPWNKLYKRAFVEQFHITWLETQSSNDLTFVCHCMAVARRVSLLDETLMHYRVRQNSIWHSKSKSPANMYEAHLELLHRMRECSMPGKVIEGVYLHLLDELSVHLSGDACDNPAERAELFVRGYEPQFGLFGQDFPLLTRHPAYIHLKAYAEPDATIVIVPEGREDGLERSIEGVSRWPVEVVLDISRSDIQTARYAESVARQYFWVRTSAKSVEPKTSATATLSPGRFPIPTIPLTAHIARAGRNGTVNLDLVSRKYRNWPWFHVCTPSRYSWLLFGLPLLTVSYQRDTAYTFMLGQRIATRRL